MSKLSHLRCDDCAFTAGTNASKCEITRIQSRLCAESGEPFYCHVRTESLCAGYVEAAIKLQEKGFHESEPEWRQQVRKALLDVIAMTADGLIDSEHDNLPQITRKAMDKRFAEIRESTTA